MMKDKEPIFSENLDISWIKRDHNEILASSILVKKKLVIDVRRAKVVKSND